MPSAAGLPRTFLCVGSLDLFAVENLAYATKLIEAGVPTELHVYAGGYHGFQMMPDAQLTKAYFRDFLASLSRFYGRLTA
ncbi:alpha/beta hydrolase [Frankia sp. AgB32]|nr:alpha/beta hydrolase [Frankia sp. AgB32]